MTIFRRRPRGSAAKQQALNSVPNESQPLGDKGTGRRSAFRGLWMRPKKLIWSNWSLELSIAQSLKGIILVVEIEMVSGVGTSHS